ncbi:MAG: peptidylprolyl isomerase [Paracoccaceae bacterium]
MSKKLPKGPTLHLSLKYGKVVCRLFQEIAPNHVKRIIELVEDKSYDNVVFHRVIDGFMAQTGDVQYGNKLKKYSKDHCGMGGSSKLNLNQEFSDIPFEEGILGMARSQDPNSANSQFFIMLDQGHFLNNNYTVFGKVTRGMKSVHKIKKGDANLNGSVDDPDEIISAHIKY